MTGQQLKHLRHSLDLTQAELAERLGYSRQATISYYENGSRPIPKVVEVALRQIKYEGKTV